MLEKIKGVATNTYEIYLYAGKQYGIDRVNRMSAAVAYRALFAAAPMLIITIYILGFVVGSEEARADIIQTIERIGGDTVVEAVNLLLDSLADSTNAATGVIGFALLLWTSSTLFLELQNDLNDIFGVPYEQTTGIINLVRKRGLGFLWALGLGLVLIVVLLLNNIWQFLGNLFPDSFEPVHNVISFLTPLVSVVVLPFVFVLFFQSLTQVKVRWRALWWGSFFTSVAFLLTSYGASLYFRITSGSSAASIAGALFVVLLMFYIFSSVFLFGAEVTKAYDLYLARGRRPPGIEDDETVDKIVDEVEPSLPLSAVIAFLGGLFIGSRRK